MAQSFDQNGDAVSLECRRSCITLRSMKAKDLAKFIGQIRTLRINFEVLGCRN